eukprot:8226029-Heterocapsa_arctica.AAC.1
MGISTDDSPSGAATPQMPRPGQPPEGRAWPGASHPQVRGPRQAPAWPPRPPHSQRPRCRRP